MSAAPYGSWESPIAAANLAVAGVRLGEPRYDGDDLYWTEGRPAEQGRVALLRERAGQVQEVAPGLNVRTRVHEYGGGAWDARAGVVVVSVDPSGQLLRLAGEDRWPLTPEGRGWRFADLRLHPESNLVLAVREDHSGSGEPVNTLVGLRLDGLNDDGGTVLASGADFYACPELATDGRMAWMEWRHPDMPWESCMVRSGRLRMVEPVEPNPLVELVEATPRVELVEATPLVELVETTPLVEPTPLVELVETRTVAGGPGEAAVHPLWRGEGLLFCSDRNGFWEVYASAADGSVTPLTGAGADLVEPFWVFGRRPYALTGDERLVLRPRLDGRSAPMLQSVRGFTPLAPDVVDCDSLDACGARIAALVLFADAAEAIIELAPEGRRVVRASAPPQIGPEWVSRAEAVSWAGPAGEVQGWFYPPVNPVAQGAGVSTSSTGPSIERAGVSTSSTNSTGSSGGRVEPGGVSTSSTNSAGSSGGKVETGGVSSSSTNSTGSAGGRVEPGGVSTNSIGGRVEPEEDRPPMIVISHGGPTAFSTSGFSFALQFWTTRGFAVLDVNYSGSSGYGRAYRERLRGSWGVLDVADCIAGAQALAAAGRVDGARLAIRGGSAGGYTTLRALTTSTVFTAGCSRYGIADLRALASDTHKFEAHYLDGLIGSWPEAAVLYAERSPINHLDRLNCPMLILQGADDAVVPPNQARAMADAVAARGLDVELIVFEGEGHGFRRADTIQRALEAELAFYARTFGITMPAP